MSVEKSSMIPGRTDIENRQRRRKNRRIAEVHYNRLSFYAIRHANAAKHPWVL
jgi:hypothetical protein